MPKTRRQVTRTFALMPLLLSGALVAPAARAAGDRVNVAGQWFEPTARVADTELMLNGTGLRAVAWFKAFAAGLYLPARADTAAVALGMAGPKRLQLRMLRELPAEEFVKALNKGVLRNLPAAEAGGYQGRLAQLDQTIAALVKVQESDVVDLDHEPGRGLVMRLNGKLRGDAIAGEQMFAAVLRAFVGDLPYDEKLKAGLLGRRS